MTGKEKRTLFKFDFLLSFEASGAHDDVETKDKNMFEYLLLSFQIMSSFRMTMTKLPICPRQVNILLVVKVLS